MSYTHAPIIFGKHYAGRGVTFLWRAQQKKRKSLGTRTAADLQVVATQYLHTTSAHSPLPFLEFMVYYTGRNGHESPGDNPSPVRYAVRPSSAGCTRTYTLGIAHGTTRNF